MAAKSRFIGDMHPRNFPAERKHMVPARVPAQKPVLSGVSMIVDKNHLNKAPAKKSFTKWKKQHDALFERKHIETTSQTKAFVSQRKGVADERSANAAKFELDFKRLAPTQTETSDEYKQFEHDCSNQCANFSAANLKRPQFHGMMAFSQLNRMARSEATRNTVPLVGQHDIKPTEETPSNPCSCRCVAVASSPISNTDPEDHPAAQSSLQVVDSSMEKAVQPKRPPTSKLLANIVEEQIEIVEQQKQILKQQNEIFHLQYQIEKLLLVNSSGLKNALSHKQLQSTASSNALQMETGASAEHCRNYSPNGRKSIGVMTSCHLNEICSPVAIVGSGSPKDTMLERINKIIENSPPMINYKQTHGNRNCRISPHRTDINISSQTLIYKASARNNVSTNEPKIADRSFALHLLDMKYHPETPITTPMNRHVSPRHNTIEKSKLSPSKSTDNDFVPSNISPDKYDYLIRHGLLKK
ncbi:uncharacterized protein LOC119074340 [Bradysia coprophila]|uniref:uncharacterized protein LOC119074340 n=1 Tax=Bradysia coprophila TaxID=38358 RepID=UPI00187DCA79|nr:uncharacterized protein LOC119074340 [Bradysia coprophila]